jgi:hypothetical protein
MFGSDGRLMGTSEQGVADGQKLSVYENCIHHE